MDAVAAMHHAAGWSGKGMALVELGMAYESVAAVYNRVEAVVMQRERAGATRTLKQALAEEVAKDQSPCEPAAAPGQEEA
jgi:hypothetical protein